VVVVRVVGDEVEVSLAAASSSSSDRQLLLTAKSPAATAAAAAATEVCEARCILMCLRSDDG